MTPSQMPACCPACVELCFGHEKKRAGGRTIEQNEEELPPGPPIPPTGLLHAESKQANHLENQVNDFYEVDDVVGAVQEEAGGHAVKGSGI